MTGTPASTQEPTHRDLCRAVAAWFIRRIRWADVVAWELGGYSLTADRVQWSQLSLEQQIAQADGQGGSVLDVVALTSPQHQAHLAQLATRRGKRPPPPRLAVCEVKRTRSDLLGDLRAGKLLKYEAQATHCYLAGTVDALGLEPGRCLSSEYLKERLGQLELDGLPRKWGVLVLHVDDGIAWPAELRHPRRLSMAVTPGDRAAVTVQIARSLAFRVLGGASPMTEAP